jgi:hypothetical protein
MQRALASSLISTIADKHISAIAVMPAKRLAKLFKYIISISDELWRNRKKIVKLVLKMYKLNF